MVPKRPTWSAIALQAANPAGRLHQTPARTSASSDLPSGCTARREEQEAAPDPHTPVPERSPSASAPADVLVQILDIKPPQSMLLTTMSGLAPGGGAFANDSGANTTLMTASPPTLTTGYTMPPIFFTSLSLVGSPFFVKDRLGRSHCVNATPTTSPSASLPPSNVQDLGGSPTLPSSPASSSLAGILRDTPSCIGPGFTTTISQYAESCSTGAAASAAPEPLTSRLSVTLTLEPRNSSGIPMAGDASSGASSPPPSSSDPPISDAQH
eukprot:CAMPEP_0119520268 /NCGR_PEP_ID=MMETSP1344-20130328/36329_1 /TAXON_ID=236787 /ORGANISM="Florenciella parvula, Strain CCMP2471" /LENGTH=267 /DNA_ID=CAMNT_0007558137 /DNA_START=293 /DNA_END=1095 /DNA_ORIENTATION=+